MPKIWYYDFSDDKRSLDDIKHLLSAERYEYCSVMKSDTAAHQSAYGFLLLRYALKKEYGITDIPRYTVGEHGKPFLSDYPGIYFNLSHANKKVVCSVCDRPIGIDIQDIRHLTVNVGRKFLTENELKRISEITDENEIDSELCRIWCIKESYGKMTGKGFGEGFCSVDADRLIRDGRVLIIKKDSNFISVCC